MGSIFELKIPLRQSSREARQAALIQRFAVERRLETDVFWLKENAEVLNVLASIDARPDTSAFSVLDRFYGTLNQRLGFFPQYYRFLVSLALDLEDLGRRGSRAEQAVHWVVKENLVLAELSDLQRAEARRLCLRRGVDPLPDDAGLDDRLRAFGMRKTTFAVPNKKASYELTHIVFYLSEYGARDPDLPQSVTDSLKNAGTIAFLEMNLDLLCEVCLALRFAGKSPPAIWENWILTQSRGFSISSEEMGWVSDDYHTYLMVQWFLSAADLGGFGAAMPEGSVRFSAPVQPVSPLRELSECMYHLDGARSADWGIMRPVVGPHMSEGAFAVIEAAERAVDFDAFFHSFARAGLQGTAA